MLENGSPRYARDDEQGILTDKKLFNREEFSAQSLHEKDFRNRSNPDTKAMTLKNLYNYKTKN